MKGEIVYDNSKATRHPSSSSILPPLQLLFDLISQKRSMRLDTFLATFEKGYSVGWAFPLSERFMEAIDMRMTSRVKKGNSELVLTQGSRFDFREGYVIYDTPQGYSRWEAALRHISTAFQIQKASPAIPATNEPTSWPQKPDHITIKKVLDSFGQNYVSHEEETKRNGQYTLRVQTKRFAGYLEVARLEPSENRTALVIKDVFPISQDGFVEWLITGLDPMLRKQQLQ